MRPFVQSALVFGERFLAALMLFVLWGALAVIAIFIHITAGSPIMIVDEWVSKNGTAVRTHRFRATGPGLAVFQMVGRWLREYAVDELPSLWDVACGGVRLRDLNLLKYK